MKLILGTALVVSLIVPNVASAHTQHDAMIHNLLNPQARTLMWAYSLPEREMNETAQSDIFISDLLNQSRTYAPDAMTDMDSINRQFEREPTAAGGMMSDHPASTMMIKRLNNPSY
ncbi:hypothetical protein ACMXYR_11080 [Neptuniibacter sp. QD29_5]|uniref:hypothetical protein n=1 Tax=Neptuniibacter sp. QD29_5 TaxID=3398207 RepID=UPI0039F4D4E2